MKRVGIFYYIHLFGIFHGHLVYFSRFGMLQQEKSGNPAGQPLNKKIKKGFT
jgi:hypothetical protein